jgi:DNA-binding transcriptional ArsR family regulator
MGTTKKDGFSVDHNELALYLKALGHPARVAILDVISQKNACICGDIVDQLPLAQSTVSQHLKELKSAGLIKGTISGKSVCYCIDVENWNKAKKMTDTFFAKSLDNLTCC